MSEIERKPYMENEIKYLAFFQMLFDLNNKELMIRINFISNSDINEFFENEKNNFVKELKKIGIENIMLKKRILIKKFDDIIYCIKLSYRDFRAGFNKVELWYENLNIKISSNSDYIYILEASNEVSGEIKKIAEKNMVYIKRVRTLL